MPSPRLLLLSDGVVADADGDADDALVVVLFAGEGAVVSDGLVAGEIVQAVLDEVRFLHAGEEEGLLAVELGSHGAEEWVVYWGGGLGREFICN